MANGKAKLVWLNRIKPSHLEIFDEIDEAEFGIKALARNTAFENFGQLKKV